MNKNLAIVLAAGRGTRAGEGLPKTYRVVQGAPLLRHSLESFLSHPMIDTVQAVIHPDDQKLYAESVAGLDLPAPVFGGETRADSVLNGMAAHDGFDHVLIHDGARPFVSEKTITNVIEALQDYQGAIPAMPVVDALWSVEGAQLRSPVSRENLVAAQTPQGFHFHAYKSVAEGGAVLDDAQAAIQAGLNVAWVLGEKSNKKLTLKEDFS